jgi:hypothetical protein
MARSPEPHEGPPWIVGWRGAPREAPENTLASLRRALELDLDGVAYDARACAGGDLVLVADASLDRTSDARGRVANRTLAELYGVDAGGWFGKRFAGETIPTLEEALAVGSGDASSSPMHVIVLQEAAALGELARAVRGVGRRLSVRVASPLRSVCVEARDLDLVPMLLVDRPSEDDRQFVRDERIAAVGARLAGWPSEARGEPWPCERWLCGIDDPDELLRACRAPINGVMTGEPRRALALRALSRLAPHDVGPHPLVVPELAIEPELALPTEAAWCGAWEQLARVRNPFAARARVELDLVVRRGAFEASGLPAAVELAPAQEHELAFRLSGGAWSPGGDPLLVASYRLDDGTELALDATLARIRRLTLYDVALRLELLRESPSAPAATVHVRRRGRDLLAAIENAGDVEDARILVHLDGATLAGARGLRTRLPADFDQRLRGVPFSIGIEGRRRDAHGWRHALQRWAGGLPSELDAGAPGRLYSASVR